MIRTLVAGYGYWGSVMAANLIAHPGFFLAAIHDPDAERLNAAAGQNIHAYKYYEEAIEKTHPELVCICTPIHHIKQAATLALTRYIDVMACKPGATSQAEYEHILKAADNHHRRYTIDYTTLSAPSLPRLQERLQGSRILEIEATRHALQARTEADIIDDMIVHDVAMISELVNIEEPIFTRAKRNASSAEFQFQAEGASIRIRADRAASQPERTLRIRTDAETIFYDQTAQREQPTPVQASLNKIQRIMRENQDWQANRRTATRVLNLTDRMKVEAA